MEDLKVTPRLSDLIVKGGSHAVDQSRNRIDSDRRFVIGREQVHPDGGQHQIDPQCGRYHRCRVMGARNLLRRAG